MSQPLSSSLALLQFQLLLDNIS